MNGKLVILAGGISSRMKKSESSDRELDPQLINDADLKSKAMIRIGENERPFLDYLLFNAYESGYRDIVIVIGEKDDSIKKYYETKENKKIFNGMEISYAVQPIPEGRGKPLGTADALYHALKLKTGWSGASFTVCNSDNLYSQNALKLMLESKYKNSMIDYDRDGLNFEKERIEKFSVTKKDNERFLVDIIEKPTIEEIESAKDKNGAIGVSMNIFKLNYDMIYPFLETVPLHPVRKEKELPTAIKMMIEKFSKSLYAYPVSEEVPDLTSKEDISKVKMFLEKHFPNLS
ncbi:MAG: sugar phosphate nucleotidyltransferase [Melioribacteraceae bacterium]